MLAGSLCRLRAYRSGDVDALHAIANDPAVSRWMTAQFPYPYTRADAETWMASVMQDSPPKNYVIEVDGTFAGAVGAHPQGGEHRGSAIFGYWLGRAFWGRGIATDAARTLARYALSEGGLRRLEATVFAPNLTSARVLEKAGFTFEARLRESYVERDGTVCDGLLYSRLASDPEP